MTDSTREAQHDGAGHRARLRTRLLEGGEGALADHELVEYLLMTAIPRRDVKPLAKSLLKRFGSLAGVFNADPRALANHPGMGETSAAAIKIVAVAMRRLARTGVQEQHAVLPQPDVPVFRREPEQAAQVRALRVMDSGQGSPPG